MNKQNATSYVWVIFGLIGLLTLVANLRSFDVGTMDHPHVISLHK